MECRWLNICHPCDPCRWVLYAAGFFRNAWWFCGVEHVVLLYLSNGQHICLNFNQNQIQTNYPREWILAPCVGAVTATGIQNRSSSFAISELIPLLSWAALLLLWTHSCSLCLLSGRKVRTNYLPKIRGNIFKRNTQNVIHLQLVCLS